MQRTQRIAAFLAGCWLAFGPLAALNAQPGTANDIESVQPLLPPGISDFDLELFGKFAYLWRNASNEQVVQVIGNFSGRMGEYRLTSRDAVIWFRTVDYKGQKYLDADIFLWQDAEILQPGGTVETGPALVVTLRTFGKPLLNIDSHSRESSADTELYAEAIRARGALDVQPAPAATVAKNPVQLNASVDELLSARPKLPVRISYQADNTYNEPYGDSSVLLMIGNVFIARGSPAQSGEFIELQADGAVVFLHAGAISNQLPGLVDESRAEPSQPRTGRVDIDEPIEAVAPADEPKLVEKDREDQVAGSYISAVYLEGDVVLRRGERMIRAPRMYYDFDNDKALILDAVTRAVEPRRQLPVYVRAKEIRQVDPATYTATDATVSTSEFHTPHLAIAAEELTFKDNTPRNETGDIVGVQAGTYEAKETRVMLDGTPIAYWPYSSGSFSEDTQGLKSIKTGYNTEFGASIETEWRLFSLLGLQEPEGYNATLRLDGFSNRGPAIGIDADYQRDDYYGLVRTYYIRDNDADDLGGIRGDLDPDTENRGRALIRHRQFLDKGWELSLEHGFLSDENFLESYQRNEFENAKLNETLARLLKREENWQYSITALWRINEFQTETEQLPDQRFSIVGEPLGDYVTWYSDNRAGVVRKRIADLRYDFFRDGLSERDNTGSVLRGLSRQEAQLQVPEIGPLKLTPYLALSGEALDDAPDFTRGSGSLQRLFFSYGVHGNMIASRVYDDVRSELLDVNRLRHVIKADFTAFNAHANVDPSELTNFTPGVEDTDDFGGVVFGLRQRLQTKRGPAGEQRTVDWITLDLEAGFFDDATPGEDTHGDFIMSRPEDSIASSFVRGNFMYRLSDSTVLAYDGVYDVNEGEMGTSNFSIAVEREPRLSWFLGYRYINATDNSLLAFGSNYKLSEKHTIGFRETYDLNEGRNFQTSVVYIRKYPRWYTSVSFDVDRSLDDVGLNFSIWPEGAPNLALGSKRFTGLGEDVGLDLRSGL